MKLKSGLIDLSLAAIPILAIAIPAWVHGPGHEGRVDETTLIDARETATAITAPPGSDLVIEQLCAESCVRCSSESLGQDAFARKKQECVLPNPGLRLLSGDRLSCHNECRSMHPVMIRGSLVDPS
jgi:hypothetical protein